MPDEKPQGEQLAKDEKLARRERNQPIPEEEDLRVKARYISDEERRAKEAEDNPEDAEKYVVTEATPSSGGVYPPSAVVAPFSADVVAAHTPGETVEEENAKSPDPQTPGDKGTTPAQ